MIRIEKDLTLVPASLRVPPPANSSAEKTHEIRKAVLDKGAYPKKDSKTDARYKMEDIKAWLFNIYHGKCAFCEQKVERWQVEHFRPKSIYYWLAFSWDNLLYACPDCNGQKSDHFDLNGQIALVPAAFGNDINTLSTTYDATELPRFIHPEREDAEPLLIFWQNGFVRSKDARCTYTLDTCVVHRPYLNDNRKSILDGFINDLKSEATENTTKAELMAAVDVLLRKFKRDAENPFNEYQAFRRYAVKHFLKKVLLKILS